MRTSRHVSGIPRPLFVPGASSDTGPLEDTTLAEVFRLVFQVFHIHPSFGRQEVSKIFIDQSEAD